MNIMKMKTFVFSKYMSESHVSQFGSLYEDQNDKSQSRCLLKFKLLKFQIGFVKRRKMKEHSQLNLLLQQHVKIKFLMFEMLKLHFR